MHFAKSCTLATFRAERYWAEVALTLHCIYHFHGWDDGNYRKMMVKHVLHLKLRGEYGYRSKLRP